MANIMIAARTTTTDVLSTISAATKTFTHGANAVSYLAEAGSLHAEHYRNTTRRRLALTEEEYQDIAEQQAKLKIARAVYSVESELEDDPKLKAIFDSISLNSKPQLMAAE